MVKVTKNASIDALYEALEGKYNKTELKTIVNKFLEVIAENLKNNGRVTISPLGTFFNRVRKARTMKHPSSGEMIQVAEGLTPAFKPSATIKREVNA